MRLRTLSIAFALLLGCTAASSRGASHPSASHVAECGLTSVIAPRDASPVAAPVPSGLAPNAAPVAECAPVPEAPLWVPTRIEDPSAHALDAFHAALARSEHGQGQTHVVFYGASHVASDLYTDYLRVKLQRRFGEAGAGFFLPVKALPAYRTGSIELDKPSGFRTTHVKAASLKADRYGLAGMYVSTRRKAALSSFSTRAHAGLSGNASRFELYYEKQPGGGSLELRVDDTTRVIHTSAARTATGYERIDVPDGPHRVELRVAENQVVRIFGMSAERETPGVVLDTLGIPGSRAANQLLWNDAIYREHLARRTPDLVVLAYGTNEAGDDDVPIARYETSLREVVGRVREVAPNASCLLIGPSDRPLENPDGTYGPRPHTQEIIDAQRRVAADLGCGFFDLVSFMGGPMAMVRWVAAIPPLGTSDHVHFTRLGYEALGAVLYDALMEGYSSQPVSASTSTPPGP